MQLFAFVVVCAAKTDKSVASLVSNYIHSINTCFSDLRMAYVLQSWNPSTSRP
jgi:hypothetical protein